MTAMGEAIGGVSSPPVAQSPPKPTVASISTQSVSTELVDTGTSPHMITSFSPITVASASNTVAVAVNHASTSTQGLTSLPIKPTPRDAQNTKQTENKTTKKTSPSPFHSALAAAVQEIQTLREQLSQSGARYVAVKQQMESMRTGFDAEVTRLKQEVAREKAIRVIALADFKRKLEVQVKNDRAEGERLAQEKLAAAEVKIEASYRRALATAALNHHLAMQKMKEQCNALLREKNLGSGGNGASSNRGLTVNVSREKDNAFITSKKGARSDSIAASNGGSHVIRRAVRKKGQKSSKQGAGGRR